VGRTRMTQLKTAFRDWLWLFIMAAFCALTVVINLYMPLIYGF